MGNTVTKTAQRGDRAAQLTPGGGVFKVGGCLEVDDLSAADGDASSTPEQVFHSQGSACPWLQAEVVFFSEGGALPTLRAPGQCLLMASLLKTSHVATSPVLPANAGRVRTSQGRKDMSKGHR